MSVFFFQVVCFGLSIVRVGMSAASDSCTIRNEITVTTACRSRCRQEKDNLSTGFMIRGFGIRTGIKIRLY